MLCAPMSMHKDDFPGCGLLQVVCKGIRARCVPGCITPLRGLIVRHQMGSAADDENGVSRKDVLIQPGITGLVLFD